MAPSPRCLVTLPRERTKSYRMQNHVAIMLTGRSSLILLRETWSWMSQVSGFDRFCSAIERQLGIREFCIQFAS